MSWIVWSLAIFACSLEALSSTSLHDKSANGTAPVPQLQHLSQRKFKDQPRRRLLGPKSPTPTSFSTQPQVAAATISGDSAVIATAVTVGSDCADPCKMMCVVWEPANLTAFHTANGTASLTPLQCQNPEQYQFASCFEDIAKSKGKKVSSSSLKSIKINGLKPTTNWIAYCVTSGGTLSNSVTWTTTAGPRVTGVSGCTAVSATKTKDCPTVGGTVLTIDGSGFELIDESGQFSGTCFTPVVGPSACTVLTCSPSRITCTLAAGEGAEYGVVVSTGSLSNVLDYAQPTITSITDSGCVTIQGPSGKEVKNCSRIPGTITILGSNFGRPTATVLIGGQKCTNVVQTSHSKITCALRNSSAASAFSVIIVPGSVIISQPMALGYLPCDIGSEMSITNPEVCLPCPNGRYKGSTSILRCLECDGNVVNNRTVCKACPPNSNKVPNSTNCQCSSGWYYVDPAFFLTLQGYVMTEKEKSTLDTCEECPRNFICGGNRDIQSIKPKPGFFSGANKSLAYSCPNMNACLESGCAPKYHGPLCANCAQGFARNLGFECKACPPESNMAMQVVGMVVMMLVIVLWLTRTNTMTCFKDTEIHGIILKILLNAMQVNGMIQQVDFRWPAFLLEIAAFQKALTSSATALNLGCFVEDNSDTFFLTCALFFCGPTLFVLIISLSYFALRLCTKKIQPHHAKLCISVAIMQIYLPVVSQSFAIFACREMDGKEYLLGDVSVECYSSKHVSWILQIGLPSLLLNVVSVPVGVAFLLKRHRQKIDSKEPSSLIQLSFLYKGYRPEKRWWEVVVLFRKVFVAFVAAFFTSVNIKIHLLVVLTVLSMGFQSLNLPYLTKTLNNMEYYSIIVSWTLFMGGSILYLGDTEEIYKEIISISIVIILFVFIYSFAFFIAIEFFKTKPEWKITQFVMRCVPCMFQDVEQGTTVESIRRPQGKSKKDVVVDFVPPTDLNKVGINPLKNLNTKLKYDARSQKRRAQGGGSRTSTKYQVPGSANDDAEEVWMLR